MNSYYVPKHLLNARDLNCISLSLYRSLSSSAYHTSGARGTLISSRQIINMPKRKSISTAIQEPTSTTVPPLAAFEPDPAPPPKRRASQRNVAQPKPDTGSTNPNSNANVLDAPEALRASPDADEPDERMNLEDAGMDVAKQVKEEDDDESPLSDLSDEEPPEKPQATIPKTNGVASAKKRVKEASGQQSTAASKGKKDTASEPQFLDPEADGDEEADEEEIQAALSRPPPVNSDYLPLPWKGRLGYVRTLAFAAE